MRLLLQVRLHRHGLLLLLLLLVLLPLLLLLLLLPLLVLLVLLLLFLLLLLLLLLFLLLLLLLLLPLLLPRLVPRLFRDHRGRQWRCVRWVARARVRAAPGAHLARVGGGDRAHAAGASGRRRRLQVL